MDDLQILIDEAYAKNDIPEIIRIGTLMGDIAAEKFKPSEPVHDGAWRNVCNEAARREAQLEARILARDEYAMMDF